jgi:hypothetical protein
MVARVRLERLTRSVDRRANSVLVEAPRLRSWTRKADHAANRALLKAWPLVARMLVVLRRLRRRAWRLLRPLVRRLFRLLGWLEPRVLRARDSAIRAAVRTRALPGGPRRGGLPRRLAVRRLPRG